MDNFTTGVGAVLGSMLFTIISLWFTQRKNKNAQETREKSRADESTTTQFRIEKRMADQEVVIDDLKRDVSRLTHIEEQYNLLKEAHDLLKKDHDELKAKFEAKSTDWVTVNGELVTERQKLATAEKQNGDLFEANKTLSAKITAYERAFQLLGQRLEDKSEHAQEPGEQGAVTEEKTI